MHLTEIEAEKRGISPLEMINEQLAEAIVKMAELRAKQELWESTLPSVEGGDD